MSSEERSVLDPCANRKLFIKILGEFSNQHSRANVFRDFAELYSIAIFNAVTTTIRGPLWEQREQRYFEIIKRYSKLELGLFVKLFANLVDVLTYEARDYLGEIFMELQAGSDRLGQFFTPTEVSRLMARIVVGDDLVDEIKTDGFKTLSEPACGGGGMIFAAVEVLKEKHVNYQQCLWVQAIDLDITCVHMCYLQMALLHIPGEVIHGNALTLQVFSRWRTPAHFMGNWPAKFRAQEQAGALRQILELCSKDSGAVCGNTAVEVELNKSDQTDDANVFSLEADVCVESAQEPERIAKAMQPKKAAKRLIFDLDLSESQLDLF